MGTLLGAEGRGGDSLGDGGMGNPGCRRAWVHRPPCPRIKSCSLTAACCQHFSAMLAKNRSLQELQLSSNNLGDAGMEELCQGLSQPGTTLRVLS